MKLADLCARGLITRGKNRVYVHSLIRHQVGQSDFQKGLMAGADDDATKERRLADMRRRLADAGVSLTEPAAESGSGESDAA